MWSIISILFFVAILGFPGFYIITRKMFPRHSKRSALWISGAVTAILVIILSLVMAGTI